MYRAIWMVTATSMIPVRGETSRNMAMSGIPTTSRWTGLLTAMAIGTGSALGAGLGLTIPLGVSRRITTVVGTISAAGGAGAQARSLALRSIGLRL